MFVGAGHGCRRCGPRPEAERWPEAVTSRTLARVAAALRPPAPAAQRVCLAAIPAEGRIAGRRGVLPRYDRAHPVPAGPGIQRSATRAARPWAAGGRPVVSAAVRGPPEARTAVMEERPELGVAAVAQDVRQEAAAVEEQPSEVRVTVAGQPAAPSAAVEERRLEVRVAAVEVQDAQQVAAAGKEQPSEVGVTVAGQPAAPTAAVEERRLEVRVPVVAAQDVPQGAAAVEEQPSEVRAGVAAAVEAQDAPQVAAAVRDERLGGAEEELVVVVVLPSAVPRQAVRPSAEPSVAPEARRAVTRLAQQQRRFLGVDRKW